MKRTTAITKEERTTMSNSQVLKNKIKTSVLNSFSLSNIKIFFDDEPPSIFNMLEMESNQTPYAIITLKIQEH